MRTPKSEVNTEVVRTALEHFEPQQIVEAYKAQYPSCYGFTREFEGGYVNDPDDPGGCTNMGITIGTLQAWRNDPTVDCTDVYNLSELEAGLIYAQNYWGPVWGNQLPIGLNLQVWDWGVNSGPGRAVEYLQQMIGATADGAMGPNTLSSTLDYVARNGIDNVIAEYHDIRQSYYESLSTFENYGDGWTRRNDECRDLGYSLAQQGSNPIPEPPQPTSASVE